MALRVPTVQHLMHRLALCLACSAAGLSVAVAWAGDRCIAATELQSRLCPARLPPVREVTIERNAFRSELETDTGIDCTGFRLTARTVMRYFARTQWVTEVDPMQAVDCAPCEAEGTLRFADGRNAHWLINRSGTARLWIVDEGDALLFYCPRCRFSPFRP